MTATAHNHFTRDIKPPGVCPGCDAYHEGAAARADRAKAESLAVIRRRDNLLAEAQQDLLDSLVAAREAAGLSIETVAARMGITERAVVDIESGMSDPTLSPVRRYALAIETVIRHHVTRDQGEAL